MQILTFERLVVVAEHPGNTWQGRPVKPVRTEMFQALIVLLLQQPIAQAFAVKSPPQVGALLAGGIMGAALLLRSQRRAHLSLLLRQLSRQGAAIVHQISHAASKAVPDLAQWTREDLCLENAHAGCISISSRSTDRTILPLLATFGWFGLGLQRGFWGRFSVSQE